jgi:hypothetical protein
MGGGGSSIGGGSTFIITSNDETNQEIGGEAGGGIQTAVPEVEAPSFPPEENVEGSGEVVTPSPEATPMPTETEPPSLSASPASITVEPLILGLQEDKAGQIVSTYPQTADQAEEAEPVRTWQTLVSDNVKIGMAALAALFGILALVFYTKR